MRQALLNYLTPALTGTIKTSNELPFEQGGSALYIKNMRKVYLDEPEVEQTQLVPTFDEDVNQNITTVRGYLATDAKNRNSDLDTALITLANARTQADISSSFRKEFDYTTTIDADKIIYEFEYRFYTLA
jgi:hypothetical protein